MNAAKMHRPIILFRAQLTELFSADLPICRLKDLVSDNRLETLVGCGCFALGSNRLSEWLIDFVFMILFSIETIQI